MKGIVNNQRTLVTDGIYFHIAAVMDDQIRSQARINESLYYDRYVLAAVTLQAGMKMARFGVVLFVDVSFLCSRLVLSY